MPALTRRAFLREEIARCFSAVTISGVTIALTEAIPGTVDPIAGAFRAGSQEMQPYGEGKGRAEAGVMTAYVRVEFTIADEDTTIDDMVGLVEDGIEAAIEAFRPSATWTHPDGRESVQLRRIERKHLIPAIERDLNGTAGRGAVIVPLAVIYHRARLT